MRKSTTRSPPRSTRALSPRPTTTRPRTPSVQRQRLWPTPTEYKDTDIDGLRKSAEEWQAKAEQAEKDADARVAAVQFDAKLDSAIAAAHGRSGKAIRALLDLDALRGSEDPDKDIPAALSALQKDSGYMFDTEETPPPYAAGTGRTAMTTDNSDSALRKAMGLPME